MSKIRRTDAEVLNCGMLVAQGYIVTEVESLIGVPKSTVHWVIRNRLERLDSELYGICLTVFSQHKHSSKRRKRN